MSHHRSCSKVCKWSRFKLDHLQTFEQLKEHEDFNISLLIDKQRGIIFLCKVCLRFYLILFSLEFVKLVMRYRFQAVHGSGSKFTIRRLFSPNILQKDVFRTNVGGF